MSVLKIKDNNNNWTEVPTIKGTAGQTGATGQPGADGYSPSASVEKVGDTATITITDKTGTTTATIQDGTNGTNGSDGATFTPSVSSAGVISWTNDGGKTNPQSVDLVAAVINALPSAVGVSF